MDYAGVKTKQTPKVLQYNAEHYMKKGDLEKALQYIDSAQKLSLEVHDGIDNHYQQAVLKETKAKILLNKKQ
jgi:tetratricopeptide (TPR) repeat protein